MDALTLILPTYLTGISQQIISLLPPSPDSTTSPSFVSNDRNVDHKLSVNSPRIAALETKGSESETSLDTNPSALNWRKTEESNINLFCGHEIL